MRKLLPQSVDNDYRGSPVAFYVFCLLMLPMTFRACVHFLKEDSGANSIASIVIFPGDPDPNVVIHMFSALWGSQQAIMVLFYGIVLVRYRSLLPLMYVTLIVESLFRMLVGSMHPMTPQHFEHTPPGVYGTTAMLAIAIVMLVLSTRTREVGQGTTGTNESAGS